MTKRKFLFYSSLFLSATVILPTTIYEITKNKKYKEEKHESFNDHYKNNFWDEKEIYDVSRIIVTLKKKLWNKNNILKSLKKKTKNNKNRKRIEQIKERIKKLNLILETVINEAKQTVKTKLIKASHFKKFKKYF